MCTGSTVPASTRALLDAGVDDSQFVRNVAARVDERSRDIDPTQWGSDAEFSLGSRLVEFQSQSQRPVHKEGSRFSGWWFCDAPQQVRSVE